MSGITLNLDGLEAFIEQKVEEKIAAALAVREPDPWLDSKAAAEYLGVTVGTIHDLASTKRLPRYGEKGHRLHFKRADLDAYLANRGRQR